MGCGASAPAVGSASTVVHEAAQVAAGSRGQSKLPADPVPNNKQTPVEKPRADMTAKPNGSAPTIVNKEEDKPPPANGDAASAREEATPAGDASGPRSSSAQPPAQPPPTEHKMQGPPAGGDAVATSPPTLNDMINGAAATPNVTAEPAPPAEASATDSGGGATSGEGQRSKGEDGGGKVQADGAQKPGPRPTARLPYHRSASVQTLSDDKSPWKGSWTKDNLQKWLEEHGCPSKTIATWGAEGTPTLSMGHLLEELELGMVQLEILHDGQTQKVVRTYTEVTVRVVDPERDGLELICRELTGVESERLIKCGVPLTGRKGPNDDTEKAVAIRMVNEMFGLTVEDKELEVLKGGKKVEQVELRESTSYPGVWNGSKEVLIVATEELAKRLRNTLSKEWPGGLVKAPTMAYSSNIAALGESEHKWEWAAHLRAPEFQANKNHPSKPLRAFDFTHYWNGSRVRLKEGTREQLFADLNKWSEGQGPEGERRCYYLMAGAGMGKTVILSEWMSRAFTAGDKLKADVVGWHFIRHQEPIRSNPAAIIKSLAAIMHHRLPGYAEAYKKHREHLKETHPKALSVVLAESSDYSVLFNALLAGPLGNMPVDRERAAVVCVDALDELQPKDAKGLHAIIEKQLADLPAWLKFVFTSRDEDLGVQYLTQATKDHVRKCVIGKEDEGNAADVRWYLRSIAARFVADDVDTEDIEREVKHEFDLDEKKLKKVGGEDGKGWLEELKDPITKSRKLYQDAYDALEREAPDELRELVNWPETNSGVIRQEEKDLEELIHHANSCRHVLRKHISDKWIAKTLDDGFTLYHASDDTKRDWVHKAYEPGIKGKDRVIEKVNNEYKGDNSRVLDLARFTIECDKANQMVAVLKELKRSEGSVIESKILPEGVAKISAVKRVKNKFASPTPLGYRDFMINVELEWDEHEHHDVKDHKFKKGKHIAEVQVNTTQMIHAKHVAHDLYKQARSIIGTTCKELELDDRAGEVENYIVNRLNRSSVDAAVHLLEEKAGGLMIYASLLEAELGERERRGEIKKGERFEFRTLSKLPNGIDDMYKNTLERCFPGGTNDAAGFATKSWKDFKPLFEVVVAATRPLHMDEVSSLLGWNLHETKESSRAVALVLPIRNNEFTFIHKSMTDWLTDEKRAKDFFIDRKEGDKLLADRFLKWLAARRTAATPPKDATDDYFFMHGIKALIGADRAKEGAMILAEDLDYLRDRAAAARETAAKAAAGGRVSAGGQGLLLVPTELLQLEETEAVPPKLLKKVEDIKRFVAGPARALIEEDPDLLYQLAKQETGWVGEAMEMREKEAATRPLPYAVVDWRNRPTGRDPCIAVLPVAVEDEVHAVACGQRYAVFARGKEAVLVDRLTEQEVGVSLGGHDKIVTCVAVTDTAAEDENGVNALVVTGDAAGIVRLWEVDVFNDQTSNMPMHELKASNDGAPVNSVAISLDGRRVACALGGPGHHDDCGIVWSLDEDEHWWSSDSAKAKRMHDAQCPPTGKLMDRTVRLEGEEGMYVHAVTFTKDGRHAVTGDAARKLRVFPLEAAKGKVACSEPIETGHNGPVLCCAVSPCGKQLVSSSDDKTVRVWSLQQEGEGELKIAAAEKKPVIDGHTAPVLAVSFSSDGRLLASCSRDETVRIEGWDVEKGGAQGLHGVLKGHETPVLGCAFLMLKDGDLRPLATLGKDKTLRLWETLQFDKKLDESLLVKSGHGAHGERVTGMAVAPGGGLAASASADKSVALWDFSDGAAPQMVARLLGHNAGRLAEDKDTIDYAHVHAECKCTREEKGSDPNLPSYLSAHECSLPGHSDVVTACSFHPKGGVLCTASMDGTIRLWQVPSGGEGATQQHKVNAHSDWVTQVAFSPDGDKLVSGCRDGSLKIWTLAADGGEVPPTEVAEIKGHARSSVGCSCDGWMATRRNKDGARAKRLALMKQIHEARMKKKAGEDAGEDDNTDETCRKDLRDCLADLRRTRWASPCPLAGHSDLVAACTFADGGRAVVSASADSTVIEWDAATWEKRSQRRVEKKAEKWAASMAASLAVVGGDRVAVGGRHGGVEVWPAGGGEEKAAAARDAAPKVQAGRKAEDVVRGLVASSLGGADVLTVVAGRAVTLSSVSSDSKAPAAAAEGGGDGEPVVASLRLRADVMAAALHCPPDAKSVDLVVGDWDGSVLFGQVAAEGLAEKLKSQ